MHLEVLVVRYIKKPRKWERNECSALHDAARYSKSANSMTRQLHCMQVFDLSKEVDLRAYPSLSSKVTILSPLLFIGWA
jgi:hypothetical protein